MHKTKDKAHFRCSSWLGKIVRIKPKPYEPDAPRPKAWWEDDWKKVTELYPVGRSFNYLSRKMVVAQYKTEALGLYGPFRPYLVCEYCDDKGKLHEWCFDVAMMPLLLPQNGNQLPGGINTIDCNQSAITGFYGVTCSSAPAECEEAVIDKIRLRRNSGRNKYGKTMERTDVSRLQWMQHAQEEAMDLAIYLERLMREERSHK